MAMNGATSIWSGYTHQGKVGLIVALNEICSLITRTTIDHLDVELDKWSLVFENAEDFDIKNDSESVWSRHQVKAWSGKDKQNNYSSVLLPDENGNPGFITDGVRENECYLHVISDITNWSDSGASNPQGIKLYSYPPSNTKFCNFAEVNDIDTLYPIYGPLVGQIVGIDDEARIRILWACLEHLLDDKIRAGQRDSANPEFSFKEIYSFLKTNNPFMDSHYYRLKKMLNNFWETRQRLKLRNGETPTDEWTRAKDSFDSLCALEQGDFFKVINIMHPNEAGNMFQANEHGMKKVVFEAFEKISSKPDVKSMQYLTAKPYVLTALAEDNDMLSIYAEDICSQMTSNPNITSQLFTESNIINLSISGSFHEFLKKTNQQDKIHDTSELAGISAEHIRDPADLTFVKLEDAVGDINRMAGS